eukprot:Gb_22965 [translate_table: standard]
MQTSLHVYLQACSGYSPPSVPKTSSYLVFCPQNLPKQRSCFITGVELCTLCAFPCAWQITTWVDCKIPPCTIELIVSECQAKKMIYKSLAMELDQRNMEEVRQFTLQSKEPLNGLYLEKKDFEFFPIYFGVTCALAALKLLGTRRNVQRMTIDMRDSSKVIEEMLKGATQLLGLFFWKAQSLIVEKRDAETWESEKTAILNKAAKAEAEVAEMKNRRAEDAKANEKVVAMFATQEHNWKNERKMLRQQMEAVLKDLQALEARTQIPPVDAHKDICSECVQKEQRISELNEKIGEKEFLMMATVEAIEAEQQERNELEEKLSRAEAIAEDLREKLCKESEDRAEEFRRHKASFIDFVSNQKHMEAEMGHTLRQLESTQRECEIILNEKKEADGAIHSLSLEITHLRKDAQEKEEVMSAMLRKSNADAEEKQKLDKELKTSKAKKRQAEFEAERWKRICEGKIQSTSKLTWRSRSISASRADCRSDLYTEMKRLQAEEIKNLHIKYGNQVQSLQNRIKKYQEKLAELERSILVHLGHIERTSCPQDLEVGCSNCGSNDLIKMRDSIEADIAAKQSQLLVAKDLIVQCMDTEQEPGKRKKLYVAGKPTANLLHRGNGDPVTPRGVDQLQNWIGLEKSTHAKQLEQKHWQEMDTFARQTRVKDERVEAFRWQLFSMERDSMKLQLEIENLNHNLKQTREEKVKLEALLMKKEQDLNSLKERLILHENRTFGKKTCARNDQIRPYEMDAGAMWLEVKAAKKKLREREEEHKAILFKIAEEVENELQEKDYRLAVVEAKLIETQIKYEQERKAKERIRSEIMKKKSSLQDCLKNHVIEEHEICVKNAIGAACMEVERLSEKIAEARDQMMQMESHHEEQLKNLVEQATKVCKSGCQLRSMKNLLQTAEDKIEKSAQGNISQALKREQDILVPKSYEMQNIVDKLVPAVVHNYSFPETCDSSDITEHQSNEANKPAQLQAGLELLGDCQNDRETKLLDAQSQVLMLRTNGISKGKTVYRNRCSTYEVEMSKDEGYCENPSQNEMRGFNTQVLPMPFVENLLVSEFCKKLYPALLGTPEQVTIYTQSVPFTRSCNVFPDTSFYSNNTSEGRDTYWKKDAQAFSVSFKIKKLEQQLIELEKMSKTEVLMWPNAKDVAPVMVRNDENGNENQQVQSTWAPRSVIHLLKKQVKRYQSLIGKIDDLCKRMRHLPWQHDKDPEQTMSSSIDDRTREQTAAREMFLVETFQLQRYVVATGQKLMAIQPEIARNLCATNNTLTGSTIFGMRQSVETAKGHLKEIQRSLEVWIARIIGDLEGILAREGILHVMPMEWRNEHKLKVGKSKIPVKSKRRRFTVSIKFVRILVQMRKPRHAQYTQGDRNPSPYYQYIHNMSIAFTVKYVLPQQHNLRVVWFPKHRLSNNAR